MKIKEFLKNHLHRYLSTVLLFGIVAIGISTYFHFNLPQIIILLFSFIWVAGLCVFDHNKKTPIPYLIVGFVILITVIIGVRTKIQFSEKVKEYYQWLLDQANEVPDDMVGEGVALAYSFLSIFFLHFICLPFYFITKWKKSRYLLAILGTIAIVVVFLLNLDLPKFIVALFFAFVFLCLIEFSFGLQYPAHKETTTEVTTFLTPIVVVFFVIVCSLPTSASPMKFSALKHLWRQVVEIGENIAYRIDGWLNPPENYEFGLAFAGFSEDALLGDGVGSDDTVALYLREDSSKRTSVYLIGNIKNEFVGDGWEYVSPEIDAIPEYTDNELDIYELTNAILQSSYGNSINTLINNRTLDITYNDFSTKTVFYTARTGVFEQIHNVSKVSQGEGKMTFQKLPGLDAEYQTKSLELRLGTYDTTEFLKEVTREDYDPTTLPTEDLQRAINFHLKLTNPPQIDSMGEVFARRDQLVKENYMSLPEEVSDKVKALAYDLTKDASSDYEKLKRIEEYLNTFTYTQRPPKVPQNENFLDYFLFEAQEGYCTYFATAMAIMSRCIDIPSRYVQGYCVPINRSGYNYPVTGNQAHAWMEAYFDGVGWIPFEPTPSYGDYLYRAKEIYDGEKLDTSMDYGQYYAMLQQQYHEETMNDGLTEGTKELTRGKTYVYVIIIVFSIVVAAILLSMIYLFFSVHHYSMAFEQAERQEQLFVLLKRILLMIQYFKFCKEENLTLYQQFMSVDEEEEFVGLQRKKITEYYMRLCYGDGNLSEKEETQMFDFYQAFMNYSKTHLSKLKFYLLQLKLVRVKVETNK